MPLLVGYDFIGRFAQSAYATLEFPTSESSGPSSILAENNTDFRAKFIQPVYARFRYSEDDAQPFVSGTNVDFRSKFSQLVYKRFLYSTEDESPAATETNIDFLGRYSQLTYSRFRYETEEDAQPPVAEINIDFLGRFTRQIYKRFWYGGEDDTPQQPPPRLPSPVNYGVAIPLWYGSGPWS